MNKIWVALAFVVYSTALFSLARRELVFAQEKIASDSKDIAVTIVAKNLKIPWEIAFLPQGDLLVTERTGTLKKIGKDNKSTACPRLR